MRMAAHLDVDTVSQVLVVGNSRLGRVKIPSCIACDRPLLDKVTDWSSSRRFVSDIGHRSPPLLIIL